MTTDRESQAAGRLRAFEGMVIQMGRILQQLRTVLGPRAPATLMAEALLLMLEKYVNTNRRYSAVVAAATTPQGPNR